METMDIKFDLESEYVESLNDNIWDAETLRQEAREREYQNYLIKTQFMNLGK